MARYTKTQITQLSANEQAALNAINKNFEDLETAIQDTVSRSGNTPTHMTHDLDLNGKRIINVPAPKEGTDLVRQQDVIGDIETVRQLVNTTTNAAAQALEAAQEVQEIMEDAHLGLVADDLGLGDDSKIKKTADNIDDVTVVADNIADISAVASVANDIGTVADAAEDIASVADDLSNINSVANDLPNIDNASEYAAASKQWAVGEPTEPVGGSAKYWAAQASTAVDNKSINKNTQDEIQTVGVIDQNNTSTAIKTWTGTQAQYDEIANGFYAWDVSGTTYYTTSETPSVGDIVYNSNREETLYRVANTGVGTIDIVAPRTITPTIGGYDFGTQWTTTINGQTIQNGVPMTFAVGSSISIIYDGSVGEFDIIISNSSNTTLIPNGGRRNYKDVDVFVMPDEDITFTVSGYVD